MALVSFASYRLDQPVKKMTDIPGRITMIDNLIANFVTCENLPPILHSKVSSLLV